VLGTAYAVAMGICVSVGVAVASGCEKGSLQARMVMERIKKNDISVTSLFERFMDISFFEESRRDIFY
jgi:hypothetical protein